MARPPRKRPQTKVKKGKPVKTQSTKDRLLLGSVTAVFIFVIVFTVGGLAAEATTGRCLKCVLTRNYQCALCPPPSFSK